MSLRGQLQRSALSIFGDHSDVMAVRQTGFALACVGIGSGNTGYGAMAHMATLESRVPFIHFFDGFRTSHEINKIERFVDEELQCPHRRGTIHAHRARALSPDHPVLRGTAQNPDVFFQASETVNPFYD